MLRYCAINNTQIKLPQKQIENILNFDALSKQENELFI